MTRARYDVVIIGSGPGGAITAAVLAKSNLHVAIIEEGQDFTPSEVKNFSLTEMKTKYRQGGTTVTIGHPTISYVEGRVWGGGSEINAGLYHRLPEEVIERWKSTWEINDFSSDKLNEHFIKIEKRLGISYLGQAAPKSSHLLANGAKKLGLKCIEAPRWFSGNQRNSMRSTYLADAIELGCKVIRSQKVEKLSWEQGRWTILTHTMSYIEARYVFVCAGAIQTPFLLKKSGIKKNIGTSFQLHPTIKMVAKFNEVLAQDENVIPVHQVKEYSPELSMGGSISGPGHVALALADHMNTISNFKQIQPHLAVYYVMCANFGTGSILTLPGLNTPYPIYTLSSLGLQKLSIGLKNLGKILFAAGAEKLWPTIAEHPSVNTVDELEKIPNQLPRGKSRLMSIHLFSTCPMGENKNKSAVNSFGRSHFVPNLYISDGSILCDAPGVNPQGTIMSLAMRNAQHFLENIK